MRNAERSAQLLTSPRNNQNSKLIRPTILNNEKQLLDRLFDIQSEYENFKHEKQDEIEELKDQVEKLK